MLMPCIKVGINEWAIVDRARFYNFSLWTDKLNGCVAVAIVTDRYAFLTHISSQVTLSQWKFEASSNFLEAIDQLGPLPSNALCEVVLGDDEETKLSWAVYQTIYTKWKESEAATNSEPEMSSSCQGIRILYPSLSNFELLKKVGHKREWGENRNTITGAKFVKSYGFLTEEAEVADISIPNEYNFI